MRTSTNVVVNVGADEEMVSVGLFGKSSAVAAVMTLPPLNRPDLRSAAATLPAMRSIDRGNAWGVAELNYLDQNLNTAERIVAVAHYAGWDNTAVAGIVALTAERIVFVGGIYARGGLAGNLTASVFTLDDLVSAGARKSGKTSLLAFFKYRSRGQHTFFVGATPEAGQRFVDAVEAEVSRRRLG